MNKHKKIAQKKVRTAFLTTSISISLVLLILGIVGFLLLNAQRLSNYVKENIGVTVYIKDDAKKPNIIKLQKILDAKDYVKSTELITKEKAAEIMTKDLGEDFVDFLGFNPLSTSINIHFYADYAQEDSLLLIQENLLKYPQVKEVSYKKDLLALINKNIKRISFILIAFSLLLFVISYTLINNTIRLSIYSKRFVIRTMKLVGATKSFIRTPFLINSVMMGLFSSLLSIGILLFLLFFLKNEFSELISFNEITLLGILFTSLVFFGIIISYIATFFAVNKYLRIKESELYY